VWQQALETKAAQFARRDLQGALRGFDGHRAAAAAGVVERLRLTLGVQASPAAGGDHRGGQRFFERRIARVAAPAALEQRLARGIDVEPDLIRPQVGVQAHLGLHGIDAGALAKALAHAVADRVFDAQGGKVQALERALVGRELDLEGLRGREPQLPQHLVGGLVERVFVRARLQRQPHQHALGQPAVQVEPQHIVPGAGELDAAALALRAGGRRWADGLHFGQQEVFHPGGAGQEQGQVVHGGLGPFRARGADGWGRCAAPRGIWPRCGARRRCLGP